MLELKQIKKDYPAGENTVHALKGVSIQFRESEFVSILGPSGCGKTTMLNIIGGLDGYTDGDLYINGRSTKGYKDRDWDTYRNHSVGFVFQSYNLISHQTVLQNVELALTLTGVSKAERRKRAIAALEQVGLADQMKKKPSEMSGGQMQRVAIARAIVNDPDIILADEPTGALDTETSVQVMEILKEISKKRLVVMVTHNPDLAETYSTRIIRMLDGEITSDSRPLSQEEYEQESQKAKEKEEASRKEKKPKMKLYTSFGLSFNNLITKKGRTILTSFAGSIGIIGIALIFAISQGMSNYITKVQEDTLSSYPLTLMAEELDFSSLLQNLQNEGSDHVEHELDAVYQNAAAYDFVNALNNTNIQQNNLKAFKDFLEDEMKKDEEESVIKSALTGVSYTYNTELLIYTKNVDGTIVHSDTSKLMQEILVDNFSMDFSSMTGGIGNSASVNISSGTAGSNLWQEMLPGKDGALISELLVNQYEVIYGAWPNKYNQVVLVVDENNEVDDMTLYALGLKTKEEINATVQSAMNGEEIKLEDKSWSYEEICDKEFRTILGYECYIKDEKLGLFVDLRESDTGLKMLYDDGTVLEVSGIVRLKEDATSGMLTGKIGYTSELTEYMINGAAESEAVKAQLDSPNVDIFTGLPFKSSTGSLSTEQKAEAFKDYISKLTNAGKAKAYVDIMCVTPQSVIDNAVEGALAQATRETITATLTPVFATQTGMSEEDIAEYIAKMSDEDLNKMYTQMVIEGTKAQYAEGVMAQLAPLSEEQRVMALEMAMPTYTDDQCATYYSEVLVFSDSEYEGNLQELGYVDLKDPSTINLYASSFENKGVIEDAIADYNADKEEEDKIKYTDFVGIMMSSITIIIDAITYVLTAFVSVSLIVSSIMIGVITLISVQERTKEIGILRAIGASKKNVSRMFNAETVIIGFASGLLGVGITYLLSIIVNAILYEVTGIAGLEAYLPPVVAVVLVIISVILTLIAGIIPSRSAAKKDPVEALRSE